jgi:1-acyl-sn-glycerol-3-phosphate acyltransferase
MLDLPHRPVALGADTPDRIRTRFGFVPDERRKRLRTRVGAWALTSASLGAATTLHPFLGRSANHRLARSWARRVTRSLDIDFTVTGLEHVDPSVQYLVMPLHEGFVDIPAILHLPLDLRFTVREELLSMRNVGPYIAATRQILVPETPSVGGYKALYADIENALTIGDSIVIFPQGSVLGVEVAFKAGVSRIAQRFGIPVLPVVISGTHRVWEYPFTQTVRFGQRVAMTVLPPVAPNDATVKRIRRVEADMKSLALSNLEAPVRRFTPERDGWWDSYSFEIDDGFPELVSEMTGHRSTQL